jgi:hypothetical protein
MKLVLLNAIMACLLLISSPSLAYEQESENKAPPPKAEAGGVTAFLSGQMPVMAGKEQQLTLRLTDKTGAPLPPERLDVVHTQVVHLLILDQSLSDYQHVHPRPGKEQGSYSFSFTPKTGHDYRVWVDMTPKGGQQVYIPVSLKGTAACKTSCVDTKQVLSLRRGGRSFSLSFDRKVRKGIPSMATLSVTDSNGQPVKRLEPVMGAYAHVVGITETGNGIAHVHPMGEEPAADTDRGCSPLTFHIEPKQAGFLKIWAQLVIDGEEIFVPFGIIVGG